VLPLIRREIPDARVLVVGRICPNRCPNCTTEPEILVSANVPDVEHYYRQAAVSVVPLRLGGGTDQDP
jgi:hypothetical protein